MVPSPLSNMVTAVRPKTSISLDLIDVEVTSLPVMTFFRIGVKMLNSGQQHHVMKRYADIADLHRALERELVSSQWLLPGIPDPVPDWDFTTPTYRRLMGTYLARLGRCYEAGQTYSFINFFQLSDDYRYRESSSATETLKCGPVVVNHQVSDGGQIAPVSSVSAPLGSRAYSNNPAFLVAAAASDANIVGRWAAYPSGQRMLDARGHTELALPVHARLRALQESQYQNSARAPPAASDVVAWPQPIQPSSTRRTTIIGALGVEGQEQQPNDLGICRFPPTACRSVRVDSGNSTEDPTPTSTGQVQSLSSSDGGQYSSIDDVPIGARHPKGKRRPCVVCLAKPQEVAIDPCGHLSMCNDCISSVQACPICRGPINKALRVYIS